MADENCSSCRFFLAGRTNAKLWEDVGGMCRRYAPQGPVTCGNSNTSWQIFPPTSPTQWCGDYRPSSDVHMQSAALAA